MQKNLILTYKTDHEDGS